MKSGVMANPSDVSIEMEAPPLPPSVGLSRGLLPSMTEVRRAHSRSASWSLPGARSSLSSTMALSSLNPMAPITNVIREIVPSFDRLSRHSADSENSSRVSRDHSQNSLLLEEMGGERSSDQGGGVTQDQDPSLRGNVEAGGSSEGMIGGLLPREQINIPIGGQGAPDEQNVGLELSDSVRWLEQNVVFIILLMIKFAWYHRSGLMVILGMFGTFLHCDQVLRRQVALKNRRQVWMLLLVVLFLGANVYFVYYVFWEQRLHFCLVFMAPHFTVDLWNLIWSIWVTDYIIRFGTMAAKALVVAMFVRMFPTRRKGKYYMLLEYMSQLYRSIVPAPMWVRYLSNPLLSGAVFAVLITSVYLMLKGGLIFASLRELYRAFVIFFQDQMYGRTPTREELEAVTELCAICQDQFSRPVILTCKHIFCENCVLQWLDRQNSCPLCRAAVGSHPPKWRDGSTATWPQIF